MEDKFGPFPPSAEASAFAKMVRAEMRRLNQVSWLPLCHQQIPERGTE